MLGRSWKPFSDAHLTAERKFTLYLQLWLLIGVIQQYTDGHIYIGLAVAQHETRSNKHSHHALDSPKHQQPSLLHVGVTNYMVGAMDPETADRLAEIGAPHFVLFDVAENGTALGLGPKDLAWGSPAFHSMGRIKINLLKTFLGYNLDVLLCDTDTVWLKDPTPYFLKYPTADILISTDHMFPTVEYGDTGLETPVAAHSAMNIGVMFFRANAGVNDFVEQWVKDLDADPGAWDQVCDTAFGKQLCMRSVMAHTWFACSVHNVCMNSMTIRELLQTDTLDSVLQWIFNKLAREGFRQEATHESNDRLFLGFNGRLAVGVLPISAFASGHSFHVQHLYNVRACCYVHLPTGSRCCSL